MAKRFCEPQLSVAEVDGAFGLPNSGVTTNQFVVNSVISGFVGNGAVIVSKDGSYSTLVSVSSPNGSLGMEGAYNLSAYVPTALTPARYKLYGGSMIAKPAPGLVFDGDGRGKGRGAVASVAIDLANYSVPAGTNTAITFSIGGATISAGSSASGTTFQATSALSGATLAAALAAGINACTNTVVVTGADNPMLGWRASQLRSLVYAWQDSANPAILRIQTRCASSAYNKTSFFQCVSGGFTVSGGGGQVAAMFDGGVSGAWQYFLAYGQNLTIEGGTQVRYGVLGDILLAGTIDPGDAVVIRTADEEHNDITFLLGGYNNGASHSMRNMGTLAQPVEFIFDDGTEWPTSNPTPTLRWKSYANGSQMSLFTSSPSSAGAFVRLLGKRYSNGNANFSLEPMRVNGAPVSGANIRWQQLVYVYLENMDISITPGHSFVIQLNHGNSLSNVMATWKGVRIQSGQSQSFLDVPVHNSTHGYLRLVDCEIDNAGNLSPHAGVIACVNGYSPNHIFEFDNVRLKNFVTGSRWMVNSADGRPVFIVRAKNVDFGGVTVVGPTFSVYPNGTAHLRIASAFSQFGYREFFIDTQTGFCDWTYGRAYPTLNAKLPDRVTPWVIHAIPTTVANQANEYAPFEMPRIAKLNTLDDGVRTFTVNFAIHDALGWNSSHISFVIEYEAVNGEKVYATVYDRAGAPLMPAPEAVWSLMANGKVRFENADHTPYKMVFTTPADRPIKKGSEISIYPRLHGTAANITQGLFICPEILVS